jgi:hypothetical protein
MILSTVLITFSMLLASAAASPVPDGNSRSLHQADSRTVYQFSDRTQLENIAVRSNGNLLITSINEPTLYEVNPFSSSPKAKLLHNFPGYIGLLGITELTSDNFALITGNLTFPTGGTPRSFSIWTVSIDKEHYKFAKVTDIPEAIFLNGLTTLNAKDGTVLVSDSTIGVVFRVNTKSGEYEVVLDDPSFKPVPEAPLPLGINGIRILGGYVYYTNSFGETFSRVRIDDAGQARGPYQTIARGVWGDDFAITPTAAYIAGNIDNVITKVDTDGKASVFAGNLNSTLVAGATSAQFGRTKRDRDVLYVVTNGGELSPVNGTFSEGGKIIAFNI